MLFSSITFFICISADCTGSIFSCSVSVQESGHADRKPFLLCMGSSLFMSF